MGAERISRRAVVKAGEEAMGVATRVMTLHKEFVEATEEVVDTLRDEIREMRSDLDDEISDLENDLKDKADQEDLDALDDRVKDLNEDITMVGDNARDFRMMTRWNRLRWLWDGKVR
jgi:uncharacterized protein YlxW (UPF0749 family)